MRVVFIEDVEGVALGGRSKRSKMVLPEITSFLKILLHQPPTTTYRESIN